MTTTQQPNALRLAHTLSGGKLIDDSTEWADTLHAAAAELRHQHARIAELEAQVQPRPSNRRTTMIDKKALQDALTNALIGYQHRLDCPMSIPHETEEMIILKYRTDPLFHAKVKALVSGVMRIVGEHLDGATTPAHEDARDAARYRWLRDNDWRNDEKMEPVIRLHLNAIWDEKIDAALAAQARNKKGIEQ